MDVPYPGVDLLEGLWALLAASSANVRNASSLARSAAGLGGLYGALGSVEAELLLEVIQGGMLGLTDATTPSTWVNTTAALVLWRAHAAAAAKAALHCGSQGRAVPDL